MNIVVVETYREDHKIDCQNLIVDIQRNEFNVPINIADQPDLDDICGFYQKGRGNFWVATFNNEVVGTIALLDIGNNNGALRKMFVKKEYRGRAHQVGQLLLKNLLQWSADKDLKEIFLGTTEKFLAAHRFYEKNNFKEIDKIALPLEFPVMKVDVKFYHLNITKHH